MDDFYTEMRSTLEDIENSQATLKSRDSGVLTSYCPGLFAEALVPINPHRWPTFVAGSALANDMPDIGDKIKTPLDNLLVAKEYLETSQSDIQWRDRFWKLTEDTVTINSYCEFGDDSGSFLAGAMSNKIADGYMDEMIETCATLTKQEKLNNEFFKLVAKDQGMDPSSVRGTGVTREFVPDFMRGDLCDRPERNARPFDDDPGQGPVEDGIILNPNNNNLNPLGDSTFESMSSSTENHKNFLSRFFDLFGGLNDDTMCPVNGSEYNSGDSPFMDKFCDMLGFFIPENGGTYHCTDPSMVVPPSPFLGDCGDFSGSDP